LSVAADSVAAAPRTGSRTAAVREFLAWWKAELVASLPASWRARLSSRPSALVIAEGDLWRELRPVAGRLAESGRVDLAALDLAGRRHAFRRLLADGPGADGSVWLLLPDSEVLQRTVSLPLAAEESLREAVGFELDRFTPFGEAQACYDFRVKGRDAGSQRLTLDLAVAHRPLVDRRLAELRELGASVVGVGTAESFTGAEAPLNLLEPDRRERPAVSGAVVAARSLAVLAGVLLLAALVLPLWQKRSRVIELLPRLATAKAGADVAERLGQEIEKLAGEHNFVLGKKQAQVPMVSLVEELSRLLPDTTWIQQLEVKPGPKGKDLQFFGETGSSSQLIEVLEKSGIVANPTFRSPLTKGVTPGTERFFIGAELKARPLPDPIPEAELVPPPKEPAAVPAAAPTASPAPATSPAAPTTPPAISASPQPAPVATPAPNAAAPAKPAAMPPQAPAPSASAPAKPAAAAPADPPKGAAK